MGTVRLEEIEGFAVERHIHPRTREATMTVKGGHLPFKIGIHLALLSTLSLSMTEPTSHIWLNITDPALRVRVFRNLGKGNGQEVDVLKLVGLVEDGEAGLLDPAITTLDMRYDNAQARYRLDGYLPGAEHEILLCERIDAGLHLNGDG